MFLGIQMLLHRNQSELTLFEVFVEGVLSDAIVMSCVEQIAQVGFGTSLKFRILLYLLADFKQLVFH